MYAFFVKIADKWRFEGFTEHREHAIEFEETMQEEIITTANDSVKTTDYKVVYLKD